MNVLPFYPRGVKREAPPTDRLEAWWQRYAQGGVPRRVAHTAKGAVEVSTVFLGHPHGLDENGQPLLFETMIFGGPHHEYQVRRATYQAAQFAHATACEIAGISE